MQLITRDSILWKSLSEDTKELINTGETVLQFVYDYKDRTGIVDYSFCVFSFAKAYEGYLKGLFLKMGFIKSHEYYGDDIRIGRILSPYFTESNENIFYKICNHPKGGSDLSNTLWEAWKQSRNLVFHYYPHNFRKLNYDDAFKAITRLIDAMYFAADRCSQVEQGLIDIKEIQKNNKIQLEKAIQSKKSHTSGATKTNKKHESKSHKQHEKNKKHSKKRHHYHTSIGFEDSDNNENTILNNPFNEQLITSLI